MPSASEGEGPSARSVASGISMERVTGQSVPGFAAGDGRLSTAPPIAAPPKTHQHADAFPRAFAEMRGGRFRKTEHRLTLASDRETLPFTPSFALGRHPEGMRTSSYFVSILAASFVAGCGSGDGYPQGTERGLCYPNGTCNAGLTCLSDICVNTWSSPATGMGCSEGGDTGRTDGVGVNGKADGSSDSDAHGDAPTRLNDSGSERGALAGDAGGGAVRDDASLGVDAADGGMSSGNAMDAGGLSGDGPTKDAGDLPAEDAVGCNVACLSRAKTLIEGCQPSGTCVEQEADALHTSAALCFSNGVKLLLTTSGSDAGAISTTETFKKGSTVCYSMVISEDSTNTSTIDVTDASGAKVATITTDPTGTESVTCPGQDPVTVDPSCNGALTWVSDAGSLTSGCSTGTCLF